MLALSPQISNFGWFWEDQDTFGSQENLFIQRTDLISNSMDAADRPHSPPSNTVQPKIDDFSSFRDEFIERGDISHREKKLSHNAYIPELQKQVETLGEKKEQLLSKISVQQDSFIDFSTRERWKAVHMTRPPPAVSATRLNDYGEIICQFSTAKGEKGSFSTALLNLEEEGFLLLNASSFESSEGRIFNNMHLKGRGSLGISDEQYLIEKLSLVETWET